MNELEKQAVECTHLAFQSVAMEVDHGAKKSLAMGTYGPVEASVSFANKKAFETDEKTKNHPKDLSGTEKGGLDLNVSVSELCRRIERGVSRLEPRCQKVSKRAFWGQGFDDGGFVRRDEGRKGCCREMLHEYDLY